MFLYIYSSVCSLSIVRLLLTFYMSSVLIVIRMSTFRCTGMFIYRRIHTKQYSFIFDHVYTMYYWPSPKPAPLWSQNQDKTGAGFRFGFLCRFFLPCAGFYYLAPVFVPEIIKIKSQDQDLTGAPVWGQAQQANIKY